MPDVRRRELFGDDLKRFGQLAQIAAFPDFSCAPAKP